MRRLIGQFARRATAGMGEGRPLGRPFEVVPADDRAGRSLVALVAILAFLASLAAATAEMVAATSAEWRSSVSREATIQVRPASGRDIEADLRTAVDLARATPGILDARALGREEAERLLEPWLGPGLDLSDLPVPRLVVLRLEPSRHPDLAGLAGRLGASVPEASLDDHAAWMSRLSAVAGTVIALALALVGLVLAASAGAVAFATRGAIHGHRDVVEVLHAVGARDGFIARAFAWRFARLGLRGGLIGAAGAAALLLGIGLAADSAAPGAEAAMLFGSLIPGWRSGFAILAVALADGLIAGWVSAVSVKRFLNPGV